MDEAPPPQMGSHMYCVQVLTSLGPFQAIFVALPTACPSNHQYSCPSVAVLEAVLTSPSISTMCHAPREIVPSPRLFGRLMAPPDPARFCRRGASTWVAVPHPVCPSTNLGALPVQAITVFDALQWPYQLEEILIQNFQ